MTNGELFDVRFDFGQGAMEAGQTGGIGYCAPRTTANHCDIVNDSVQESE